MTNAIRTNIHSSSNMSELFLSVELDAQKECSSYLIIQESPTFDQLCPINNY